MFDFEKLEVYQVARRLNQATLTYLFSQNQIDAYISDQWKRCSINTVLYLSEGSGRVLDTEKKHFITLSRGAVFECVTLLQLVKDLGQIDTATYEELYSKYEQVSKMLLGMYRSKG